jgi:hypothetical protein
VPVSGVEAPTRQNIVYVGIVLWWHAGNYRLLPSTLKGVEVLSAL